MENKQEEKKMPAYVKHGLIPRAFNVPDMRAVQPTDGDSAVIDGHAAVFDQKIDLDWMFEVIRRGAFDGCNFSDVLFSTNHDLDKIPLARSRNNNTSSTLQLNVDERGLFIKASLDVENNMDAKALYSAVGRGDISGMSFIFRVADQEWIDLDTDKPTRFINKIAEVIEVSAVSWPAYPGTDINARDAYTLESAREALESARAELESSTNARSKNSSEGNNADQTALEIERFKTELLLNI